jgi:hypothetical protein
MLDPQKTFEREGLLKRHRELQAEIAQHQRNIRELEAQLPIEEQKWLKPGRHSLEVSFIERCGTASIAPGSLYRSNRG